MLKVLIIGTSEFFVSDPEEALSDVNDLFGQAVEYESVVMPVPDANASFDDHFSAVVFNGGKIERDLFSPWRTWIQNKIGSPVIFQWWNDHPYEFPYERSADAGVYTVERDDMENDDYEKDLRIALTDALVRNALKTSVFASFSATGEELASSLEGISNELKALRINSISDHVAKLDELARKIKQPNDSELPEKSNQLPIAANSAISILISMAEEMGSKTGARLILAGAIGALLGTIGVSAVTAYGLTLAAWNGPRALEAALKSSVSSKKTSKE